MWLDSGALYLALAAIICVVFGVGAVKRLFANKFKTPQRGKERKLSVVRLVWSRLHLSKRQN
jgi:hypothetical protein